MIMAVEDGVPKDKINISDYDEFMNTIITEDIAYIFAANNRIMPILNEEAHEWQRSLRRTKH